MPKGGAKASSLAVELTAGGLRPEHTKHVRIGGGGVGSKTLKKLVLVGAARLLLLVVNVSLFPSRVAVPMVVVVDGNLRIVSILALFFFIFFGLGLHEIRRNLL